MRTIRAMSALPRSNEIAALKEKLGLKYEEMAVILGCSKGHVADLCSGRRLVSPRIARRLEGLTGRPWHEWVHAAASRLNGAAA